MFDLAWGNQSTNAVIFDFIWLRGFRSKFLNNYYCSNLTYFVYSSKLQILWKTETSEPDKIKYDSIGTLIAPCQIKHGS
jgi:hypothetical protein